MTSKKRSKLIDLLAQGEPWIGNHNDIWLASTVRLYRNVENFPFPGKMTGEQSAQLRSFLSNNILAVDLLDEPEYIAGEGMEALEKEFLLEHYLSMQSFHQAHSSEGFVVDRTGQILAVINLVDHLQLQLTDCAGELEKSLNRLANIEMAIGKSVKYAYSNTFGYLTADPQHCGTGLVIYVFLHLPALIHTEQVHQALEKHCPPSVESTGIHGNPSQLIGDVIALHNKHTLGLTEEEILSSLTTSLTKMVVAEKATRKQLEEENNVEVKDRVSRAYGLLRHGYQAETIEAMNAISLLKLGLSLGWIEGVDIQQLNALFFNCRRGHLLAQSGTNLAPEEVLHSRAELIHKTLTSCKLKI